MLNENGDVLRLILGEGLKIAVVGVAVGLLAAFFLTRLLESLLVGVTATDPLVFAANASIVVGVALLASLIPARRAARVEPMQALRSE
jgi:ABC-type antimicrobial peptide transport system permease subunit